jgi:neutral ceramidase
MRSVCLCSLFALALAAPVAAEPEWRAGIARREITPQGPIWMGGYAARKHPSEGVLQPLWAKSLVLEDRRHTRVAVVTLDLIGIDRALVDRVAQRVRQATGIPRERLVVNCSHTHSGPVVAGVTPLVYDLTPEQQATVNAYARRLEGTLAELVAAAVADLRPATLQFAESRATFAANRRALRDKAVKVKPTTPRPAPVDHGVPVLVIGNPQGRPRAVLFGYACHNTTLAIYQINGDYAGFAQAAWELRHPGATALFLSGCGADVNPHPRGEVTLAQQHGAALAAAVDQVLGPSLPPVHGPLQVGFERVELKLVPAPSKAEIEQRLQDKNVYQRRLARYQLDELAAGRPLATSYPYPVQVVRMGDDLLLVVLGGETCVDYALRLRREFADRRIWIAGYSNEVFAYVPSEHVLREGGYEGGDAMVYFGLHGPFQPGLEQRILDTVHRLATAP